MPPKKIVRKRKAVTGPATVAAASCYSRGTGMTAGLELWTVSVSSGAHPKFLMFDRSADGRFAGDVVTWNAATGLSAAALTDFASKAASVASATA
jgi:hypothetical protein